MKKPLAIIEISSTKVKLLVGCMVNETPIVVYRATREIPGVFENGNLVNRDKLISVLSTLKNIRDESARMEISINEVNLVLPINGLAIYQTRKTTTTVTRESGRVEQIDIENVINQVKNEKIPEELEMMERNTLMLMQLLELFLLDLSQLMLSYIAYQKELKQLLIQFFKKLDLEF